MTYDTSRTLYVIRCTAYTIHCINCTQCNLQCTAYSIRDTMYNLTMLHSVYVDTVRRTSRRCTTYIGTSYVSSLLQNVRAGIYAFVYCAMKKNPAPFSDQPSNTLY